MPRYKRQVDIKFSDLQEADLLLDANYLAGDAPNLSAEPISRLVGVGNQGGFRYIKRGSPSRVVLCALVSSLSEPDWPDALDVERGIFTYYGDNRTAGNANLHTTKLMGNRILRDAFNALHTGSRADIPLFLVFTKLSQGRSYQFRGLAVPGVHGLGNNEDLIAIWKSDEAGHRFQNYRARFTILPINCVSKAWINEVRDTGNTLGDHCHPMWRKFVKSGKAPPLICSKIARTRTKDEQLPQSPVEWEVLNTIVSYYKQHAKKEYAFEACAAELCKMSDSKIISLELTPPTRDGGRDGLGVYRLGMDFSYIAVEFSLEAKCYAPKNGNGVKLTSRLISRLRHRQFGYFVTTSYVCGQAYDEIVDDRHPVIIFSGRDISRILIESGINSKEKVLQWLHDMSS